MYNKKHTHNKEVFMNIKLIISTLILLLSVQVLYAKKDSKTSFLLKANDNTSFMNYEFHNLAYEAALKKDYENAYRIYLKLANKGDERAEYNIGMMYMNGLGVDRAKMDAYKWLRRASKHGNKEATLYFKEMNDRYAAKHNTEPESKIKEKKALAKAVTLEAKVTEKNISTKKVAPAPTPAPVVLNVIQKREKQESDNANFIYMIAAFVLFTLSLVFFFLKKSKNITKESDAKPKQETPQNSLVYRAQMFDITYSRISDYHTALLKQVNMAQLKADETKMKIYYMFIFGVIDYFCQLENFTDAEQRRVFNTHISNVEGKDLVTSITQTILEGQKDHSMYHYQAAGGISAQDWHEQRSSDALSMLKKVMTEQR